MFGQVVRLKPLAFACAALASAGAGAQQYVELPALLQDYCVKCHNLEDYSGGLDIEGLNFGHVEQDADAWEKIVRKVKAGMMPPADQERPDRAAMDAFAHELEAVLDANVHPHPTPPALHRLNRNEYANAIRDIFSLDINAASLLPQDDASEGFDNIAAGLGISPALIQGYTSAAMKISRWVVGDMTTTESAQTFQTPAGLAQDQHLEGMPLGTRGGMRVTYNFPLDAEYDFSVRGGGAFGRNISIRTIVMLDGKELKIDNQNLRSFRLPVTAGEHELVVAIIDTKRPTGVNDIYSEYTVGGGIDTVEITGPFNASGPGETASRERVFSCYPQSTDEERACAERIAVDVATRAFRR
ncbi:MAG: DUF1587 domain-containing protein, partial [Pseudomonadota bacterium]|nr:DUF1587 domain-containing protein [Pseudomonadota bacterium]